MPVTLVFNELSIEKQKDCYVANDVLVRFIKVCLKLVECKAELAVRVRTDFFTSSIAENYSIHNWCWDKNFARDDRSYLLTVASKSPYIDNLLSENGGDSYSYEGKSVTGLGVATFLDGIAVSIKSDRFHAPTITIHREYFDNAEVCNEPIEVRHASTEEHVEHHQKWIKRKLQPKPQSVKEMWERREKLFPNLIFCKKMDNQLKDVVALIKFDKILSVLETLNENQPNINDAVRKQKIDDHRLSDESETSNNNPECLKERTSIFPDGKQRYCDWHIKLENGVRLYFAYEGDSPIFVGYFGKHLETGGG